MIRIRMTGRITTITTDDDHDYEEMIHNFEGIRMRKMRIVR